MSFSSTQRRHSRDGEGLDLILLALVIAAAVSQTWDLRFTTGDDLIHAVHHARGTMGAKTTAFATENGRIWLYLFMPLFGWVAALPHDLLFRCLTTITWIAAGTLPALVLRPLIGAATVRLWLALFWGWLVLAPHAPPPSWPVMMCLPVVLFAGFGLAVARIATERGGGGWMLLALGCFGLALPHYESITILNCLYAALVLGLGLRVAGDRATRRRLWTVALGALALLLLYAIIYVTYRYLHPVAYAGMRLAEPDTDRILNVIWRFGGNGLGLLRWLVPREFVSMQVAGNTPAFWTDTLSRSDLVAVGTLGWIAAIATGAIAARALARLPGRPRHVLPFLLFGVLVALGAVGLQALAVQWQEWASNGFSTWLPTRFAWFGVVTIVACLFALPATMSRAGTPARIVTAGIAGLAVFAGALAASAASAPIRVSMRVQSAKFQAFDKAMTCAETRDLVRGSTLVGPHLFDWVDHAAIAEVDFYDVWAKWKFNVPLHVVAKADTAAATSLLTHQLQLNGRLASVAVRGTGGEALLLASRSARGFLRFTKDDGSSEQRPFDPRKLPRCGGGGFVRYELPAGTNIETVAIEALPR